MDEETLSILEDIIFYCDRIELFKEQFGDDIDEFLSNDAYNMSCAFSLMQIGECVKRISEWLCSVSDVVDWNKVCRFRDFIAHNYGKNDNVILWDIIENHIPILKMEIKLLVNKYK